jgi:hypothetical protein
LNVTTIIVLKTLGIKQTEANDLGFVANKKEYSYWHYWDCVIESALTKKQ